MRKRAPKIPVLEAKNVFKAYGAVKAVQGVSLKVMPGEAVALLGPNGAGKTTLVELLEGLQAPDEGEIRLFGLPWRGHELQLRARLGICLQETHLVETLRVDETLRLFASFYRLPESRVEAVLDLIRLREKRSALTDQLSGGQRQRLALGLALLNEPELLLLDEPTTGLDPKARQDIWGLIQQLLKRGHSLLLTTHYMEEAESLCKRVVFMSKGKVIADGSLASLKKRGKKLDHLFIKLSGERLDA